MNETMGTIFTWIIFATLAGQILTIVLGKASGTRMAVMAVLDPIAIGFVAWLVFGMADPMWRMVVFAIICTSVITAILWVIVSFWQDFRST